MKLITKALLIWLGISVANFIWQALSRKKNWNEAFMLSFYQGAAIAIYIGLST